VGNNGTLGLATLDWLYFPARKYVDTLLGFGRNGVSSRNLPWQEHLDDVRGVFYWNLVESIP
jgi:hypothetical protein